MTRARALVVAVLAIAASGAVGYAVTVGFGPHRVGRMLPWVLGRGLGVAAFVALTALTVAGLWMRHPWRVRWRHPAPEAQLRVHALLAALTLLLLAGHVLALVLDTYAGVGWRGAFVPGRASYRPVPVALGTVSLYVGLLAGLTAALAGRLVGRAWLPVHKVAVAALVLAWGHAVLAGSDSAVLSWMYVGSGALVVGLFVSRWVTPAPAPRAVGNRG